MTTGGMDRERLRQLAAIAAMEGILAGDTENVCLPDGTAINAVKFADAVVAELGRTAPAEGTERKESIPDVSEKLKIQGHSTIDDLANRFGYHKPDPITASLISETRKRALDLALWLNAVCPPSRECSLAITILEEASMWAVKALVLRCPLGDAHA